VAAFGKLIRTTAFRLTLVYLLLFALFAASLLAFFAWNTRRLITEQITTTVDAEASEINEIYLRRGLRGLAFTVGNRALRPGANLYLITTPTGVALGGNIGSLAPGVMATTGWSETAYRRIEGFVRRATEIVGEVSGGVLCAEFAEAMDDDLSVPAALAVLQGVIREGNKLVLDGPSDALRGNLAAVRAMLDVLGLDPRSAPWVTAGGGSDLLPVVDQLVAVALQERAEARTRKDFAAADRIRDRLTAAGIAVEDTPDGPRWTLAEES